MSKIRIKVNGESFDLDDYTAAGWAEGFEEAPSANARLAAWQYLQTTRLGYKLQGYFGRTLRDLISKGLVAEDYDAEQGLTVDWEDYE